MTCRERALKRMATDPRMQAIFRLEPHIAAILNEVTQVKREPGYYWYPNYSRYKRALMQYVGWEAELDELRTETDYDLIIGTMDDLLPLDCMELYSEGISPSDSNHPCYDENAMHFVDADEWENA